MNMLSRSISLATLIAAVAVTGAYAQDTNPSYSGVARGPTVATAGYPAGYSDPALSPGMLSGQASVPAFENPNVRGATGNTIVPGDRSSISGDLPSTVDQKSGAMTASDAPG